MHRQDLKGNTPAHMGSTSAQQKANSSPGKKKGFRRKASRGKEKSTVMTGDRTVDKKE